MSLGPDDFALFACGSNSGGQLGIGDSDDANRLTRCQYLPSSSSSSASSQCLPFPPAGWSVEQLSSGANHTVALLAPVQTGNSLKRQRDAPTARRVWFAGDSSLGQRGSATPVVKAERLDSSALLFTQVDIGILLSRAAIPEDQASKLCPKHVECGWNCTFIVFQDIAEQANDVLISLGSENDFGELGCENQSPSTADLFVRALDLTDGNRVANGSDGRWEVGAIAAGPRHAIAQLRQKDSNVLIGWGAARHGQLTWDTAGSKPPTAVFRPTIIHEWQSILQGGILACLAAGKQHSVVNAFLDGILAILGSGKAGKVDDIEARSVIRLDSCWNTVVTMTMGQRFSDPLRLISIGSNAKGQFGVGTSWAASRGLPSFPKGLRVKEIACGSEHVLALFEGDVVRPAEIFAWGWNEHGNLAQGDEEDRLAPVNISLPKGLHGTGIWAGCGTSFIQARKAVYARIPKVELHAHLNGSIRRSTLAELTKLANIDHQAAFIVENDARSLSEMFAVFDVIHKVVRGRDIVRRVSKEVLEDMEADGVTYAEIRTTPQAQSDLEFTDEDYVEAVLAGMQDYAAQRPMSERVIARLLLSIDRRSGKEAAERCVDLALLYKTKGVVGIDLSGDPTKGDWTEWEPALQRAREAGLKITLHAGEVPDTHEEMSKMLDFSPERLGHVCFISPENEERLLASKTCVELCLTSNILSRSTDSYEVHHFAKYMQLFQEWKADGNALRLHVCSTGRRAPMGAPSFCICTDDSAVFGSSLTDEYGIVHRTWPEISLSDLKAVNRLAFAAAFIEDGDEKYEVDRRLDAATAK